MRILHFRKSQDTFFWNGQSWCRVHCTRNRMQWIKVVESWQIISLGVCRTANSLLDRSFIANAMAKHCEATKSFGRFISIWVSILSMHSWKILRPNISTNFNFPSKQFGFVQIDWKTNNPYHSLVCSTRGSNQPVRLLWNRCCQSVTIIRFVLGLLFLKMRWKIKQIG